MTSRRIRKLRLSASNVESAQRGATLVEDAFHTASLPNLGGRLLVVRSMSLGAIRLNRSSASVALAIEERLRLLDSTAVYAEDPSAPCSPVVYFHNEAEPYILLALRAARGLNTDAWFWPLAAPCFHRSASSDEILRAALYESRNTEAKAIAIIAIVRALIDQGVADRLFAALRWQDGPELLRAIDCSEPKIPTAFAEAGFAEAGPGEISRVVIPARWSALLDRWARAWGVDDARSIWLAASMLIMEKPARGLVVNLLLPAQQLIMRVTRRRSSPPSDRDPGSGETDVESVSTNQPALANEVLDAAAEPYQSDSARQVAATPPTVSTPDKASSSNAQIEDHVAAPASTHEAQPAPFDDAQPSPSAFADFPGALRFTDYAGIFFLLPVMSRLGLPALLSGNPQLIESDLPARLLLRVGARLDIAADDPVMSALTGMCSKQADELRGFVQPELWKQGIYRNGPLLISRVAESPRERILFDASGRLALALWRDAVPNGVRQLAGELAVRRGATRKGATRKGATRKGATVKPQAGLDLLIDAWLTAMRRWCRRYARIGLRDLVCRPGRVAVTGTHVDVVFDHRQADIRVRKVGLDLDLGWLPWFGRVVSFYYRYGEYPDG